MRLISLFVLGSALVSPAFAAGPGDQPMPPSQGGTTPTTPGQQGTTQQGMQVPQEAVTATRNVYQMADYMQQIGAMAAQRGSSKDVKDLGKDIQGQYQKLYDQVGSWAKDNQVSLTEGAAPTTEYDQEIQRLQGLQGKEFDRAFLNIVVDRTGKQLTSIDQAMQQTKHEGFRNLMDKAVPVLDKFNSEAKQLQKKLGT